MAKLKNGILGPISGKINGYITSTWRNVNYIKKASPPNNRPKSEAQIAQQEKFKFAQQLIKPMRLYFLNGFQHLAGENSELNLAFSLNYKAIDGKFPDLSVDYNKVFISRGKLTPLQGLVMQQTAPQAIELTWDYFYEEGLSLSFDDQVMVMIYCPDRNRTEGFTGAVNREAGKCTVNFTKAMSRHRLEIFVGATARDRRDAANSLYAGSVLPAEL